MNILGNTMVAVSLILGANSVVADVNSKEISPNNNLSIEQDNNVQNNIDVNYSLENVYFVIENNFNINFDDINLDGLTKYLAENLKGFDEKTCKLKMVSPSSKNRNGDIKSVTALYVMYINGFETKFSAYCEIDSEYIYISSNLHKFNIDNIDLNAYKISDDDIEKAKKKVLNEYSNLLNIGYEVKNYEVIPTLDNEFNPALYVRITFINESENNTTVLKTGTYYLNYFL